MNELKEEIPYLQQALVSLDELADDQNNEYAFGFTMGDENYVKKGEDGIVYIIAEGSDLKMHEITHIHQSLKADGLRFSRNGRLFNAGKRTQKGLDNEVEAYRVQYSISKRFPGNNNRRGILGITPTSVQQIRINGKKPYAW